MELRSYLQVLQRRLWVLIFTVVVATAGAALISYMLLVPKYKAAATLWVPTVGHSGASTGDILLADRLMNTYAALATSYPVLAELEQRLGIPPSDARDMVSIGFEPQTELMRISVEDTNPERAADIATNLAEILVQQTQRTDAGRDRRVSLFATAGVPDTPMWLSFLSTDYWRELNIAVAFLISLIVGLGLVFFFEYLDQTLYTTEAIETVTELTTLGEIPVVHTRNRRSDLNGDGFHAEAFRYLRTSIYTDRNTVLRTLLCTSALPGEGKSTIVANLASAVAQTARTVIVVDADLRLPRQHKIFNVGMEVGLTSVLRQTTSLADAIQESDIPGVSVLSRGPQMLNPAELLDSPQMIALLRKLKQQFDLVLIDSPSLLAVSDAAVLAPMADGVVLVVGRAQVQQDAMRKARGQLAAVGANIVGLVVNRATSYESYYSQYMSAHTKST